MKSDHMHEHPQRTSPFITTLVALACATAFSCVAAQAEGPAAAATLVLSDLGKGAPAGVDEVGNGIGFVTWQDGGGSLALSTVTVAPGDTLALPGQESPEDVLRIEHNIASWGGFTHAYANDELTRWEPLDLSAYDGIRFWFAGAGSGGMVQVDLFDNRNPELTGDTAERWFYRFSDDSTEWKLVEIPFTAFARRTDFQPGGAPDDGLGLDQTWGWALGFPPGEGTSHVARVAAYGAAGTPTAGALTVEFARAAYSVTEGDEVTLTTRLSAASDEAVSVRVFVRAEDAEAFRDFVPRNELLIFPAGQTEASITVRSLQDSHHEGNERALAMLDGPKGAELGFTRRAIVQIQEDDQVDPDLLEDFAAGLGEFTAGPGTVAEAVDTVSSAATARPGQDLFERMLSLSWQDAGSWQRSFSNDIDASHADGIEFWYRGDGSGRTVNVTVMGARDEARAWDLVWSDEFDGAAGSQPDFGVWTAEIGDGSRNGNPGWGNAERQYYTDEIDNLSMDGEGNLVIRALETGGDAAMCYYGTPCEYTSARIITAGSVEVLYGRIETRLKLPFGQGIWPAFWTLGNDIDSAGWPQSGEIDIMEHIGREPTMVYGTVHGPGYSGAAGISRGTSLPDGVLVADDFHVFAVDWTPDSMTWSVDGVAYSSLGPDDLPAGANWVFDHPHYLILNLAVGGNWPGYPDATTVFPQELLIDYVRVLTPADSSERFTASFVDDTEGWLRAQLPFNGFARSATQPQGAPNTGVFALESLWGFRIDVAGGPGNALIDEVRWYVD